MKESDDITIIHTIAKYDSGVKDSDDITIIYTIAKYDSGVKESDDITIIYTIRKYNPGGRGTHSEPSSASVYDASAVVNKSKRGCISIVADCSNWQERTVWYNILGIYTPIFNASSAIFSFTQITALSLRVLGGPLKLSQKASHWTTSFNLADDASYQMHQGSRVVRRSG